MDELRKNITRIQLNESHRYVINEKKKKKVFD